MAKHHQSGARCKLGLKVQGQIDAPTLFRRCAHRDKDDGVGIHAPKVFDSEACLWIRAVCSSCVCLMHLDELKAMHMLKGTPCLVSVGSSGTAPAA